METTSSAGYSLLTVSVVSGVNGAREIMRHSEKQDYQLVVNVHRFTLENNIKNKKKLKEKYGRLYKNP